MKKLKELNTLESINLIILAFTVIVFGFYPQPLMDTMQISVNNLINNYQTDLVYHLMSNKW